MSTEDILDITRRLEAAKNQSTSADVAKQVMDKLKGKEPDLHFTPAAHYVVFMEESIACMNKNGEPTKIGSLYVPEGEDNSCFIVGRVVAQGPDSKVPTSASHVMVMRGSAILRGDRATACYVKQSIGHMIAHDDAIVGWFGERNSTEG